MYLKWSKEFFNDYLTTHENSSCVEITEVYAC